MFSYGSGSTATMFSFLLREGQHPFSLSNIAMVMNVSGKLKSRREVYSMELSAILISYFFLVYTMHRYLLNMDYDAVYTSDECC